jgi:hypothetical protein
MLRPGGGTMVRRAILRRSHDDVTITRPETIIVIVIVPVAGPGEHHRGIACRNPGGDVAFRILVIGIRARTR